MITDEKPIEGEVMAPNVTTTIAEYNATTAALTELGKKYKGKTYDVSTTIGMKTATAARAEIRGLRVALEKKRQEVKAEVLDKGRRIDSEAKRITAAFLELEEPIDEQIKAEESRKEQEKQEKISADRIRIESIQLTIQAIRDLPVSMADKGSEKISAVLIEARNLIVSEEIYQEFQLAAQNARESSVLSLEELLSSAIAREQEAARMATEREELDRRRAEQDRIDGIQRQLDVLRTRYLDAVGKGSAQIEELGSIYEETLILPAIFGEFTKEAERLRQVGIDSLQKFLSAAKEREGAEKKRLADDLSAQNERDRIANVQKKLDRLRTGYFDAVRMGSTEIANKLLEYENEVIDISIYDEFTSDASDLKQAGIVALGTLYSDMLAREKAEAKVKSDREALDAMVKQDKEDQSRRDQEARDKKAAEDAQKIADAEKQAKDESDARELAEKNRKAVEKKLKLEALKRGSLEEALGEIFMLATAGMEPTGDALHVLEQILLITEANLPAKVPDEPVVKTRRRKDKPNG